MMLSDKKYIKTQIVGGKSYVILLAFNTPLVIVVQTIATADTHHRHHSSQYDKTVCYSSIPE